MYKSLLATEGDLLSILSVISRCRLVYFAVYMSHAKCAEKRKQSLRLVTECDFLL